MQERQWEESCQEDGPKHFQCFCDKIYPSYSGVYLHLKYKHSEIFTKYELDNIIKYFQKKQNSPGKNIYRLQNMPGFKENKKVKEDKDREKDKEKDKERQKEKEKEKDKGEDQGKKDRRRLRPRIQKKKKNEESQDDEDQSDIHKDREDQQNENKPQPAKQQSNLDQDDDVVIIEKVVEKKEEFDPPSNNRQQPIYRQPYPYPSMPYSYAGTPPNFPSINNAAVEDFPFHPLGFKPSFRQVLEQCLAQVETQRRQIIQEYRDILYGLMHHIDKNYERLKDSRVGNKILLSYCGIFSGEFVAPLIKEYSDKLKATWRDGNHIVSELCLGRILFWLKVKRYTQPQMRPHPQPAP